MEVGVLRCAVTAHLGIFVLIQGISSDGAPCMCLIEGVEHRIVIPTCPCMIKYYVLCGTVG